MAHITSDGKEAIKQNKMPRSSNAQYGSMHFVHGFGDGYRKDASRG
jgi:hypothetical protein